VAKGRGVIASRIRAEAERCEVPMVHDKPLARALHAVCEIGDEIPIELYNAVATVLAFVMALKRRGARGGVHSLDSIGESPVAPARSPDARAPGSSAPEPLTPDSPAPIPGGAR